MLPQAVAHLAMGWRGDGPLDLSGLLVVVPTQQAGRRLREALAAHADKTGQAVFPPRVVAPEALATMGLPVGGIASRLEAQLAWVGVLRGVRLEDVRAVFPLDPPARDFAWARRLAEQLLRLEANATALSAVIAERTATNRARLAEQYDLIVRTVCGSSAERRREH